MDDGILLQAVKISGSNCSFSKGKYVIQHQKTPQKRSHKEAALSPKRIPSFYVLHFVCSHFFWKKWNSTIG